MCASVTEVVSFFRALPGSTHGPLSMAWLEGSKMKPVQAGWPAHMASAAPGASLLPDPPGIRPPGLRSAETERACIACPHFSYRAGLSHKGDGTCSNHGMFYVHEVFTCDAFEELHVTEEIVTQRRSQPRTRPVSVRRPPPPQKSPEPQRSYGPSGGADFFSKS